MPCCAIQSCRIRRNSLEARRANLSFHIFPKDPEKRLQWLERINRPGWEPNDATALCSRHFTKLDFIYSSKGNKLYKGAIPSLHLHDTVDEKTMAMKAKERKPRQPKQPKTKVLNVTIGNDDNADDVPLMDIKIEATGEQTTYDDEMGSQERSIIADVIKSIICCLDLLIKSDSNNARSTGVKEQVIAALFVYRDFVDDKDINLSYTKEVDLSEDNDLKEIDILIDETTKDINMDDSTNYFDDDDDDGNKYSDDDMDDQAFLSTLRNKNLSITKKEEETKPEELIQESSQKGKSGKKTKSKVHIVVKSKSTPKKKGPKKIERVEVKEETKGDHTFVSTVPRFMCDICEMTLISEHHLTLHKLNCRRRHYYYGNPKLEEYWNNIKCPLCVVECRHRGNLGRHYVSHRIKDMETAFEPIKIKELNRQNPEKNMQLLIDFITDYENNEKLEREKKEQVKKDETTAAESNSERCNIKENSEDIVYLEKSDVEHEQETVDTKKQKGSISEYLQFNIRKIIFDLDINKELHCFPCGITFDTKEKLEEHRKKLNDTDAIVCNYCDKTFSNPTNLIGHTKTHKGIYNRNNLFLNYYPDETEDCPSQIDYRVFACKFCLVMFVQEPSLTSHYNSLNNKGECYIKRQNAPRGSIAKILPEGVTRRDDGKIQCDKCNKSYKSPFYFWEHYHSHSETIEVYCECGKGFKTKHRLIYHIGLMHNKKVICEICGVNVSKFSLIRHLKQHSDQRPHNCTFCTKAFKFKETLIAHTRTHTHEKPWKCQYCGMAFSEKRRYNIHVNIHEGKTPYKCNLCWSEFFSKLRLNKHMMEHRDFRSSV